MAKQRSKPADKARRLAYASQQRNLVNKAKRLLRYTANPKLANDLVAAKALKRIPADVVERAQKERRNAARS